jgi:hypothetical protein
MKNIPYIGNGAYCYANSTSMLLASIGENISPSIIEVLTGVGLSASLKRKNGFLYFNNQTLLPDLGITKVLEMLGFTSKVEAFDNSDQDPFGKLRADLEKSPAVLGPLDMVNLVYNPRHKYLKGADHFVLAYKMRDDLVYLHDPAGFPHVFISTEDLKKAWQAERVSYRKGYYRYITNPKRKEKLTNEEVYERTIDFFKSIYRDGEQNSNPDIWLIGKDAIAQTAKRAESESISEDELGHFVYFALPLGAKRALDFATFFDQKHADLASIKRQQAEQFGHAHTYALAKEWKALSKSLENLGNLEQEFRDTLLKIG